MNDASSILEPALQIVNTVHVPSATALTVPSSLPYKDKDFQTVPVQVLSARCKSATTKAKKP